ncbi:MAG: hypothetical protein ACJ75S_02540 [Solirubrobacterales bacterium]
MADSNPTSGGRVVPIDLAADHIAILRRDLSDWLAGVREDLERPDRLPNPERARREAFAFERLLAGLDRGEILIPDEDARAAIESAAEGHDRDSGYVEIATIHDAHHRLLALLGGPGDEEAYAKGGSPAIVWTHRAGGGRSRRLRFPEAVPPRFNHSVLTGTLTDDPRLSRNPVGEPVILLRVEFPVADPERPQMLWTWATCEVEVPAALADRHGIRELEGGAAILAAGQLSERWAISGGRPSKRAAIVAGLVHPGPPPGHDELLVPGGGS